jgi:hypothetical protein
MLDIGHISAWILAGVLLTGWEDDDDDNWIKIMMEYTSLRMVTELAAMSPMIPYNAQEMIRTIDKPFAGSTALKDIMKILDVPAWFDDPKEERFDSNIEKLFYRNTPILSQIDKWIHPEEQMTFFRK